MISLFFVADAHYFRLEEGDKCIGDSGYIGEPSKVIVTKDQHSSEFKEFMARGTDKESTGDISLASQGL